MHRYPIHHRKISLITPPSIFLLDERVFMSLGVLKVAAVLEAAGIEVSHLDLSGVENFLEVLETHLQATDSTIIGITATTPQLPLVAKMVRVIRAIRPDLRIILGGPHATLVHAAAKLEKKRKREGRAHQSLRALEETFDVIVCGDGEIAVFDALAESPPKWIDADDRSSPLFLSHAAYEASPFPARHLVDVASYQYQIEGVPSISLISQLGCPFGCGFCGGRSSDSLRVIRARTSDNVVSEIRLLYENYGFRGFMFYDDELNVNKKWEELLIKLCELQNELGVDFRFRGFIKAELFTQVQAKRMFESGFRWILSGFESGSPRVLRNMNKGARLEENTRALDYARSAGLKVKALMSIGHPGESRQTVSETHAWLSQVRPDDFDCSLITTYPGSPYYDDAVAHDSMKGVWTYTARSGDRLHAWNVDFFTTMDHFKGDPNGGYRSYVFTDHLMAGELVELRGDLESSLRSAFSIPYPQARPAIRYERSMGLR